MAVTAERVDRARPRYVHQRDLNWCWAAALEAWTRVDSRCWSSVKRQDEWIADTGLQPYLHSTTKALNIQRGIPYLATRFHLRFSAWNTGLSSSAAPALSALRDCLRQSHAFAVFEVTRRQASHCVLVYSIGRNTVYYMDPNVGFQEANIVDVAVSPLVMLYR